MQRQDAEHDGGESTKVCELQNAKLGPIFLRYLRKVSVAYDLTWWMIAEWQFRSLEDDEVSTSSFGHSCFFRMPRTPILCFCQIIHIVT